MSLKTTKKTAFLSMFILFLFAMQSVSMISANENQTTEGKRLNEMTDDELHAVLTQEEYDLYKANGDPQSEVNSLTMTMTIAPTTDGACVVIAYGIVIPVSERIVDFQIFYSIDNINWIECTTVVVGAGNVRTETANIVGLYGNYYFKSVGIWDKRSPSFPYPWIRQTNVVLTDTKTVNDDDTSAPNIILELVKIPFLSAQLTLSITDQLPIGSNSGVSAWSMVITRNDEAYLTKSGTSSVITDLTSITLYGEYHVEVVATNNDNDRVGDKETTPFPYILDFLIEQVDTSEPTINWEIVDLGVIGSRGILTIYDFDTIPTSNIKSWSIDITLNGVPYGESIPYESETFSTPVIIVERDGLTNSDYLFTQYGDYVVSISATNGVDITNTLIDSFHVHDYTKPIVNFEGCVDQTDGDAQIAKVLVSDPESGLSQVIILFGFDLELLDELGIEIDMNAILSELLGLGIDIDLLNPEMIWIPVRITSENVIGDLFNYLKDTLLGDIIGESGSDLLIQAIETYFGASLEDLLGDSWDLVMEFLGDYIADAFEWIDIQFAELMITITTAIYDLLIDLLLDEDFIAGQKTYEFSIDMQYFAWLRLWGSFQYLVIASNTETILPIFTTTIAFSNIFTLSDDDTILEVSNFDIYGNSENIIIEFIGDDISGITLLGLTIDNVPILPCLYTVTQIGNAYMINIPRWWLVPLAGEDFHTATLYIMDNDNDWIVPYLIDPCYGSFDLEFELIPPVITYEYTGNYMDDNTGFVNFFIADDSEIVSIIGSESNEVLNILDVPQTFTITVIDKFGNSATLSVTITIRLNILAHLEGLKAMCLDCDCWTKKNYQATMIQKIDECIALYNAGEIEECYDKLLHDIKPKLTALKMDENGNAYGNADFKNAWISNQECRNTFNTEINLILHALNLLF